MSTSAFSGADATALKTFAADCTNSAEHLESVRTRTTTTLCEQFAWTGPDADTHRSQWVDAVAPGLAATVTALREAAARLIDEAEQQLATSAAGAGTASGVGADGRGTAGVGTAAGTATSAPSAPPVGGSPQQTTAWWRSLSPQQRMDVIEKHPEWIGQADGVPATARDQANRKLLRTESRALQQHADDVRQRLDDLRGRESIDGTYAVTVERMALEKDLGETARKLAAADAIGRTIAHGDAIGRPQQLIGFDLDAPHEARATIAVGDVDTADHVAVYVPGFTTTVAGDIGADTDMVARLRENGLDQLHAAGRDESVAAVAWLGYEAPQWDTTLSPSRSVASADLAQQGATSLDGFLSGVGAARETDPHLTVVAHSYGSTTAGYALQHDTGVDDVVFAGSPGIATDDASTLHVPAGHAYAMEASGDGVAVLGRFGPDPSVVPGLTHLTTSATTSGDASYSAVSGHTHYFDAGSTSLHNASAVVAGLPDHAVEGRNLGPGDVIREAAGASVRSIRAVDRATIPHWP